MFCKELIGKVNFYSSQYNIWPYFCRLQDWVNVPSSHGNLLTYLDYFGLLVHVSDCPPGRMLNREFFCTNCLPGQVQIVICTDILHSNTWSLCSKELDVSNVLLAMCAVNLELLSQQNCVLPGYYCLQGMVHVYRLLSLTSFTGTNNATYSSNYTSSYLPQIRPIICPAGLYQNLFCFNTRLKYLWL